MNHVYFLRAPILVGILGLGALFSCQLPVNQKLPESNVVPYQWNLPPGYPLPKIPADNPMTVAKVELGRHLFYDKKLSVNDSMSCASCHEQARAFSDGKARSKGVHGDLHPRNSMALSNVAYSTTLTWSNPHLQSLETQMITPIFGEDPPELGLVGKEQELLAKFQHNPDDVQRFQTAFPDQKQPISLKSITQAIASFERSLISADSDYDRFHFGGDPSAMSMAAQRGESLFLSERLECFHCHGGFNFSDSTVHQKSRFQEYAFHNNGLYNLDSTGAYPTGGQGLFELNHSTSDQGKFKAPSLRNISKTAPYMHDGSITSLDQVIDHYAAGGRTIVSGPNKGIGADNPNKSGFVKGFKLSQQERSDLLAFLESLTDQRFLSNPAFSDPQSLD